MCDIAVFKLILKHHNYLPVCHLIILINFTASSTSIDRSAPIEMVYKGQRKVCELYFDH